MDCKRERGSFSPVHTSFSKGAELLHWERRLAAKTIYGGEAGSEAGLQKDPYQQAIRRDTRCSHVRRRPRDKVGVLFSRLLLDALNSWFLFLHPLGTVWSFEKAAARDNGKMDKSPSIMEASKPGFEDADGSLERTRSITKDAEGNTIVKGEDGDTFVIDQKAERALLWQFDLRILPLL